jgi:site-specific DNA-methyltransferase (adenine-specific)
MTFDQNVLAYGDNLDYLRGLPTESVDLIYLDPPYNSKRDYNATFGAEAQIKAFKDTWTWGKDDERALHHFAKEHPTLGQFMLALGGLLPKQGLYPYLVAMAIRLVEMQRVLKPTGSIYLHVDPTASHYLKLVMDQIFGGQNFRNEIVWFYNTQGKPKKGFAKKHDTLLCYSKTDEWEWNKITIAPNDVARYNRTDEDGRRYQIDGKGYKYYLEDGRHCPDVWDIPALTNNAKERIGYPTQKPLALLERIIQASSNEGDVVLDPFMGSGTTLHAAAGLGRNFIGFDQSMVAFSYCAERLRDAGVNAKMHGVPTTVEAVAELKQASQREFEAWVAWQAIAKPVDDKMKKRLFGLHEGTAYMATTDVPPTVNDVKALSARMKQVKAKKGRLVCFHVPTDPEVTALMAERGIEPLTLQQLMDRFSERTKATGIARQMELV